MSQFAPEDHQGAIDLVSDGNITLESDRNQDGSGDLVFRTAGVERARIKSDGSGTGWPNVLGGSITAVAGVTITSDRAASGTGDIVFLNGLTERLRIENTAGGSDVKITSPLGSTGNGLNIEHDSTTTPVLRLHQTNTGPIAKWRQGTTDQGFILNDGSFRLIPAADGRGAAVENPTWSAGHTYAYGTKDGIFFVSAFTDASGTAAPLTFSKLFGGNVIKTGHGNHDSFWTSIDHQGDGETGLFIGDVTANATGLGGNIWGGHFLLNQNIASNAFALRLEFNPTVSQATKTQYGLEIKNDNDSFALTQALRIRGNWTNPVAIYSDAAGTTPVYTMDSSGNLTTKNQTTGTLTATGQIQSTTSTDGATLLRFNTDRPWTFKQGGTAGSTVLRLSPESVGKVFRVTGPAGTTRQLEITADDTAASGRVSIIPDAGGQIGFFGAATVTQPSTAGTSIGFTAGAGTAVTHLSTFTGNTGATAYTIGDIVNALKLLGLMKS